MQYTSEELRDQNYAKRVFDCVTQMEDILTLKKQNLFIYDCSGISRSATVVAGYLAIFKKYSNWQSLPKIEEHLKTCNSVCFPNLRVI